MSEHPSLYEAQILCVCINCIFTECKREYRTTVENQRYPILSIPFLGLSKNNSQISTLFCLSHFELIQERTIIGMFIKRNDDEGATPTGREDSTELQKMLTSCMINRQILVRGVHAFAVTLFDDIPCCWRAEWGSSAKSSVVQTTSSLSNHYFLCVYAYA